MFYKLKLFYFRFFLQAVTSKLVWATVDVLWFYFDKNSRPYWVSNLEHLGLKATNLNTRLTFQKFTLNFVFEIIVAV